MRSFQANLALHGPCTFNFLMCTQVHEEIEGGDGEVLSNMEARDAGCLLSVRGLGEGVLLDLKWQF